MKNLNNHSYDFYLQKNSRLDNPTGVKGGNENVSCPNRAKQLCLLFIYPHFKAINILSQSIKKELQDSTPSEGSYGWGCVFPDLIISSKR
ncbi:hypothetical protein [Peribacillus phoenicis]|uniref:hypothetical protein n=1 Tax=Peribacillus sp. 1P06PA-2 TaxID=3132295 RepID=UPI0039A74972